MQFGTFNRLPIRRLDGEELTAVEGYVRLVDELRGTVKEHEGEIPAEVVEWLEGQGSARDALAEVLDGGYVTDGDRVGNALIDRWNSWYEDQGAAFERAIRMIGEAE